MTVPDTDTGVDHRHLDHPSVNGAVTHYSGDGSDEATGEYRSMFARAFEKIESLFGLSTDGFMTSREMKQCHDEFYLHGAAAAACEAGYAYERRSTLEKFAGDEEKSIHFIVGFAMAGK
ncbi:unnamed protein product [Umbelopsis vinacea]